MAHQYQHPRVPATRWIKPRSCFTASGAAKKRYRSRSEAKRIARLLARQDGSHMEAYACEMCQAWHIGHVRGEVGA